MTKFTMAIYLILSVLIRLTIHVWGWNSKYYLYSGMLPAKKRPWFEHEILDQFFKYSETPEERKTPKKIQNILIILLTIPWRT